MIASELIVIGAGPAGAEAAIMARSLGLEVLVIDESPAAGGQIYHPGPNATHRDGNLLRETLNQSGATLAFEHRVWTIARSDEGFEVAAAGPAGPLVATTRAVIVASGAIERFYPRPGWTLPGVIGLGAATIMMKAHGVLPGRRVLVAGPGPLAPLVAHLIDQGGGRVAAVVDPNPRSVWLNALPAMTSRIELLFEGARWITRLLANRVPILHGWDIQSIQGSEQAESVTVVNSTASRHRVFEVDAVCFGYGLLPSTEFYRLLEAEVLYDAARGGWVPKLDAHQRTTIPRLYAAGDGAALLGVAAAPYTGRIAALTAALDLERLSATEYDKTHARFRAALQRTSRFGGEVARMMQPRASFMRSVPDDTIVCRCEDVDAGQLRLAVRRGACEINALKAATRCGMGPCGGRMCGEAAAALMECEGVERQSIGHWTARPPLRPIAIEALTGDFDYADIPVSEPAPL